MVMKGQLVRIVPVPREDNGLVSTMGTKVYVGDQELTGVTKIVLTAEVGGIWTADGSARRHSLSKTLVGASNRLARGQDQ
jgi:hypothetical protein